ncbi:fimbrial protein [Enterobacter cloacae]|nr:fimbrial protein [Enterobacter cloacae]
MFDRKKAFCLFAMLNVVSLNSFSDDKAIFYLTANIVNNTCEIATIVNDVRLPVVDAVTLQNSPAGTGGTGVTPFSFSLTNCGQQASGVQINFNGNNSGDYLSISNNSTANNVAIKIMDANKNIIPIGGISQNYDINAGDNILNFYAEYIATGKVTPGTVEAQASFDLIFP